MIPHDPVERRALIGEYQLGLLDEHEAAEVRQLLENDENAARMANASQLRLYAFGSPLPFTGEGLGERAEIPRNGHLPLSEHGSPEGRGDSS
ncbi:hypothetical protein QU755_16105 [Pseudomonas wenzhouensis]|nr:hypothetical protein [Pseudomonas wenzhouensis]MDM9652944.1 hypothetical protein [Pseudomonas wenzhouensis]